MIRHVLATLLVAAMLAVPVTAEPPGDKAAEPASVERITYPDTRRDDVVDTIFGERIADPFRWLENDVRSDPEVAAWVAAENRVTDAYLGSLPARDTFKTRIQALYNYERYGLPRRRGAHYFYTHNSGLQNQALLYVRDTIDGPGRVLLDPNAWSADGNSALAEWSPSEQGRYLLYSVQENGSDWRTLKVLDVATGRDTGDSVGWVKFALSASWARDESGFFYGRYPEPPADARFQALNENHRLYFHRLGTPQSEDRLVYETPAQPTLSHHPRVSDDGRWLVITTTEGTDKRNSVTMIDLTDPAWTPRTIIAGMADDWAPIGNLGTTFYWLTNKDAPRYRIVSTDVSDKRIRPVDVVKQQKAWLDGATLVGGVLMAAYIGETRSMIRRFRIDGKAAGEVALPGIGTAAGFGGDPDNAETFFAYTSFATPSLIYRYDVLNGDVRPWAVPHLSFDPARYVVEQRYFASKDGTMVPLFVVRRKDVTGPAPTILYAYGGFSVAQMPGFSSTRMAWIEQGGVFALAGIRGGGEFGTAWHDAGRLANKQNGFDDFIAASEYLIAQGITTREQLAIQGGSNGGLLVGAVVNQRPDLYAAAMPSVGVMDMLRFDRFTAGRYWVDDYGRPSREADFRVLRAYSPYHNIQSGKLYPAILATTADTDDRVVPAHTFKYTAALQAADIGPRPHLVRIEMRAGHGQGKPTDKVIEEYADLWAFAAKWTGMDVKAAP